MMTTEKRKSFAIKMSSGSQRNVPYAYQEDYYNLDDIIATQERLPSRFEVTLHNLGFLDPGSESKHVASGTKMELPYWVARALSSRKKQNVAVEVPKQYKEGYREILNADATVVDLHKLGPYYYVFGTHLLGFEFPESMDVARSMLQAFQHRFRRIMDSSQNTFNEDTTPLTQKLDETERAIFHAGQKGLNEFQNWETRKVEKLTTSNMVLNHRKRKRAIMDA